MIPQLRAQVIAVLEQAGCRNREDSLPTYASGGCFSVIGGDRTGVNVTCQRWNASEDELGELFAGIAAALRSAGLEVHELASRVYVAPEA